VPIPTRGPVTVEIDGDEYELGAGVDPLRLIEVLAGSDWWEAFLLIDDGWLLVARVADRHDAFTVAAAKSVTVAVVEEMTGFSWFTSCALAATAASSWSEFDGLCAYRGFDPWSAPVARTLAFVHHCLLTSCADEAERARMIYKLSGAEAADAALAAGARAAITSGRPDPAMARLEAESIAQWQAAFGPNGELRNPAGAGMPA